MYWAGPDAKGLEAAELGPPPFTYEVEVILDGVHHVATATWPDDEIVGEEPAVLLEFSPELPAQYTLPSGQQPRSIDLAGNVISSPSEARTVMTALAEVGVAARLLSSSSTP